MTIYHGSPLRFKSFEGSGNQGKNFGHGHYFTEKWEEAEDYALRSDADGYVYTVDLNVHHPYNPRDPADAKRLATILNLTWSKVSKNAGWKDWSTGLDETDRDNYYAKLANELVETVINQSDRWGKVEKAMGDALRKAGFDSIHDPVKQWWVVPDPSRIKIRKVSKIKYGGWDEKSKCNVPFKKKVESSYQISHKFLPEAA